MTSRFKIALGSFALIAIVALITAYVHRVELINDLPPKVQCATQAQAHFQAGANAIPVLGTGSMYPYIPAAAKGQDPFSTVVAYAVPSAKRYADIQKGDLVVYWAEWLKAPVMHQAVQQGRRGWIMCGLNNRVMEVDTPVTEKDFRCVVDRVYVW